MISSKKLIPIVALLALLLGTLVIATGAIQSPPVQAPGGSIVESPNARAGDQPVQVAVPQAPALPAPSGKVAFDETFSGNLDGWQSVDAGADVAAQWLVADGRLQQGGLADGSMSGDASVLVARNLTFGDGTLQAYVYSKNGSSLGVVFRGSDSGYYRVSLFEKQPNNDAKLLLEKVSATATTEIAEAPVSVWPGFTRGQWLLVQVTAQGQNISVSVGGAQVISATDSAYSAGWAGVWSTEDRTGQFDNFRIQLPAGR